MGTKFLIFCIGAGLILLAVISALFNFSFLNFRQSLSTFIIGNIALAMFYLIRDEKNLLWQFLFLGVLILITLAPY